MTDKQHNEFVACPEVMYFTPVNEDIAYVFFGHVPVAVKARARKNYTVCLCSLLSTTVELLWAPFHGFRMFSFNLSSRIDPI